MTFWTPEIVQRLHQVSKSVGSFAARCGLRWVLGGLTGTISSGAVPEKTAKNTRKRWFLFIKTTNCRPDHFYTFCSWRMFEFFVIHSYDPKLKSLFSFFKMLIRCWDTRVQNYPTYASKIFGAARKRRIPAEKCSYRNTGKANMFKAKTLIEKVGSSYLIGALIISQDNSWPPPLPLRTTALKIHQSNIFTLYQHGSSSQTHIDTHTHTVYSSAEHILALSTWLTFTNKLTHIDTNTHTHTHTHTLT